MHDNVLKSMSFMLIVKVCGSFGIYILSFRACIFVLMLWSSLITMTHRYWKIWKSISFIQNSLKGESCVCDYNYKRSRTRTACIISNIRLLLFSIILKTFFYEIKISCLIISLIYIYIYIQHAVYNILYISQESSFSSLKTFISHQDKNFKTFIKNQRFGASPLSRYEHKGSWSVNMIL